jgi:hypothetical protein
VEREVVEQIALEDLALLEVLQRIDQCLPLESGDTRIHQRLAESGLATFDTDMPRLTLAGIELCKSLQHRVAADAQAARILEQREAQSQAAADGGVDETRRAS